MMVVKLSQRKLSRLVAEAVLAADEKLPHLSAAEKTRACSEHMERERDLARAPDHIKIIRKFGVTGALRGFADEDVRALIEAKNLAERERRSPGDFVSAKVFAAGQANANGKSESYDHDEIRQEALRIGYFELRKGSHGRKAKRLQIVENLRLRKQNPATSDDSWSRTLSRILDQ